MNPWKKYLINISLFHPWASFAIRGTICFSNHWKNTTSLRCARFWDSHGSTMGHPKLIRAILRELIFQRFPTIGKFSGIVSKHWKKEF